MEVSLSCEKDCSFIIQILLENSGVYQLNQFLEYSFDFILHLFTDQYASRVIETVFKLINDYLSKGYCGYRKGEYSEDEKIQNQSISTEQIQNAVKKIVEKIVGNIGLLACDSNGSHVLNILYYLVFKIITIINMW